MLYPCIEVPTKSGASQPTTLLPVCHKHPSPPCATLCCFPAGLSGWLEEQCIKQYLGRNELAYRWGQGGA